ncbi:aminotransferase class III-fold pyridoxal phosphate-dependent enzyme, partial [Mesorhizobium sp.]|uniref:aminotransferase class III-fold pyridoxal phosphate-dependent enzyme n=1 Tax=Mesorhizobium sp. TaxID=1871066 RepID=UPI0025D64EC3
MIDPSVDRPVAVRTSFIKKESTMHGAAEVRSHNRFALQPDDSAALLRADRKHLTHAWPTFRSAANTDSLLITGGDGAYVFDATGRRYLDGMGGLWCVNMGYGRDEIADAVAQQLRQMPYYNPTDGLANVPA